MPTAGGANTKVIDRPLKRMTRCGNLVPHCGLPIAKHGFRRSLVTRCVSGPIDGSLQSVEISKSTLRLSNRETFHGSSRQTLRSAAK
jgi:hypothetical protein